MQCVIVAFSGHTHFADPENSVRVVMKTFFSHQCVSQRAVATSLKKQLDLRGPIASLEGSVPVFLRKPYSNL